MKEKLQRSEVIFIVDIIHDAIASKDNNIPFIFVAYGFGNVDKSFIRYSINRPIEILNILKG